MTSEIRVLSCTLSSLKLKISPHGVIGHSVKLAYFFVNLDQTVLLKSQEYIEQAARDCIETAGGPQGNRHLLNLGRAAWHARGGRYSRQMLDGRMQQVVSSGIRKSTEELFKELTTYYASYSYMLPIRQEGPWPNPVVIFYYHLNPPTGACRSAYSIPQGVWCAGYVTVVVCEREFAGRGEQDRLLIKGTRN
jgi:hypothetical protein